MPDHRLRARDLSAPFYGIRTKKLGEPSLREMCEAFLLRMPPNGVFSHGTAARLYGVPLPHSVEREERLHISVPRGRRAVDAAGVAGHQVTLSPDDLDYRLGLPLTSPERTWCDLAAMLPLPALVAAGDFIVFHKRMLSTRVKLEAAASAVAGRRGSRNRRLALVLLDERSESPRESVLRVAIVEAGLPFPEVNVEIFDDRGHFVARVDLCYRQLMIILEYEGDHHRTDRAQWRRDIARIRRLQALGWRVLRYTDDDIANPGPFLAELAALLS